MIAVIRVYVSVCGCKAGSIAGVCEGSAANQGWRGTCAIRMAIFSAQAGVGACTPEYRNRRKTRLRLLASQPSLCVELHAKGLDVLCM